jgi:Septum formation
MDENETPAGSPVDAPGHGAHGAEEVGYEPWPTVAAAQPPVDTVSVVALVLSVVGMGLVAVPLAVWGLLRARGSARRGRGLAVAALGISLVWVVAGWALLLSSGLLVGGEPVPVAGRPGGGAGVGVVVPTPTAAAGATREVVEAEVTPPPAAKLAKSRKLYWEDLKRGMCVRAVPDDVLDVTVVDCRSAHAAEVTARTVLAGKQAWPGDDAVDAATERGCVAAFATYIGIGYDDSRFEWDGLTTDRSGWEEGDNTLICLAYDPSQETLTSSLRGSAE